MKANLNREFYMPKDYTYKDYGFAVIGIGADENGDLYAIAFSGKRTRPDFHYSYRARLNNRFELREKSINDYLRRIREEKELADKRKAARYNFENGFKVGDILYDSWGYEQTNIDFYQVIEVKPKSVIIRPIGQEVTEEGNMSGHTIPIKDCFTGEPVTKKLTGWWNGEKSVATISSKYGSISLWDGKPKYCSWYA